MSKLVCPSCGNAKTQVVDTRSARRRRKCPQCSERFSTVETIVGDDIAASSKWPVGSYVQRKGDQENWRGQVVGHYSIPDGIGCCVESAFENKVIRTFLDSKLKPWAPPRAQNIEWTPDMLAALRDKREKGHSYLDCADWIGVSVPVVAKKCHELGIGGKRNNGRVPGHVVARGENHHA